MSYPAPSKARVVANRAACIAALGLVLSTPALEEARAQDRPRIVTSPPQARVMRGPSGAVPFGVAISSGVAVGPTGEAFVDLVIKKTDATIYNPATNTFDRVSLRSYGDANASAPAPIPFIAPTIEVLPGETVRMSLKNDLEKLDPSCPTPAGPVNTPHCFNSTNMHAHGLWVSPSGNSDNVLLRINPTVSFQYEYNIPSDHPAGTYWYHPHLHGSTAVQVASGMAGVLIVRGRRVPESTRNGDIDTLLRSVDGTPYRERIILLQQIQYACRNAGGNIKTMADGRYLCEPSDTGGIEGFDQFGPGTWSRSGRYTSVNGEVLPTFTDASAGRIERWRVVHAGVRDTVRLQFRKMLTGAPGGPPPTGPQADWIAQNCPGDLLPQFTMAHDGLTRDSITEQQTTVMQPGYRTDLLMVFPEAGAYCVIDDGAPADAGVTREVKSRKFLGKVEVGPGQAVAGGIRAYLSTELLAAADRTMPAAVRAAVVADLQNNLSLRRFAPHRAIADSEVTGQRNLELKVSVTPSGVQFQIDGKSYDPKRIDQTIALGSAEEWTLSSFTSPPAGHPFHIHVNPFQIMRIVNPAGMDVSMAGETSDAQYANLKGVWKDTIFIKPGYKVVIRSRFQRYIGDFVLHCHILDHEDQGMMQNVRIGLPDGSGGIVGTGHH